jgi:hypothetical protein
MASGRFSDELMDRMRQRGDDLADPVVADVLASGRLSAVHDLMHTLVENDGVPPDGLPPNVADFLVRTADVDPGALPRIDEGERLFAEHGPEIVLVLLCSSLPAAYGCRRGVKVLHETAYLARRPTRRIVETAQMIIDVMSPGGLGPKGRGIRSAQKVRLMHAAVRHLLLSDPQRPWNTADLGIPINQEDLAGTLLTFSTVVVDGLKKLDIDLTPDQEEAYLDAWRAVGRIMGVVPELLPASMAEGRELMAVIDRRQTEPSPEGREMMAALVGDIEQNLPPLFTNFAPALVRHFIPPALADGLGVPSHRLEDRIAATVAEHLIELSDKMVEASTRGRAVFRSFSLHLFQWLMDADRGGKRTKFDLPTNLRAHWAKPPGGHEPGVWHQVLHRLVPSWL